MSTLKIADLHVSVAGHEILHGVDLEVRSGEVHALMGPNGSGKSTLSHALMGRGDYEVTSGSITIDGEELARPARRGSARSAGSSSRCSIRSRCPACRSSTSSPRRCARAASTRPGCTTRSRPRRPRSACAPSCCARGVNDEFSGGEKKRAETVQLAVLEPKFAVLDEIDSGLDVDALRDVARRVERMTQETNLGVLAITHYARAAARAAARPRARVARRPHRADAAVPSSPTSSKRTGYEGIAAELGIDDARS